MAFGMQVQHLAVTGWYAVVANAGSYGLLRQPPQQQPPDSAPFETML